MLPSENRGPRKVDAAHKHAAAGCHSGCRRVASPASIVLNNSLVVGFPFSRVYEYDRIIRRFTCNATDSPTK